MNRWVELEEDVQEDIINHLMDGNTARDLAAQLAEALTADGLDDLIAEVVKCLSPTEEPAFKAQFDQAMSRMLVLDLPAMAVHLAAFITWFDRDADEAYEEILSEASLNRKHFGGLLPSWLAHARDFILGGDPIAVEGGLLDFLASRGLIDKMPTED